jgi:DNA-binding transcriptional ArsR family regulator
MLLCQLVGGERSVNALGALAGVAQPSLSQQLGVLRGERLVATRREGKQVLYRLASAPAIALLQTLYGLFCQPLAVPAGAGNSPNSRRKKETA